MTRGVLYEVVDNWSSRQAGSPQKCLGTFPRSHARTTTLVWTLSSLMLGRWTHRRASYTSLASCLSKPRWRSTHTYLDIARGDDFGPTRNDAHKTVRVRKDEWEKGLPLPPLLDPVIVEERSRWETTKFKPVTADFSPFQKKLQASLYGNQSIAG